MPRHKRGWGIRDGSKRQKRRTPLKVALIEPALLTLIAQSPRYGYSLLSELEALGLEELHPSVVYRTLRQLADLEWIESEWDTDTTQGPPRRLYRLTRIGEAALETWQEELHKAQASIQQLLQPAS